MKFNNNNNVFYLSLILSTFVIIYSYQMYNQNLLLSREINDSKKNIKKNLIKIIPFLEKQMVLFGKIIKRQVPVDHGIQDPLIYHLEENHHNFNQLVS